MCGKDEVMPEEKIVLIQPATVTRDGNDFSSIPTSQGFDEGDGDKCKAWIAKVKAADYVRLSTLAMALGTTMSSEKIADFFTPARDDALTFIGSDGEIRGA
ncbi:Uncharacterized protein ALO43_00872 [Pseudomonas tremae]|uniref:Uncharacterized protein n=2 Tax=Pseudomonas syringae group TaxID=136849 RepID=A0AA40P0J5_9PSED|nr:Uncharacterized protein ALO77_02015 [Pseudomonas coronafaciens pv. garcae]KPY06341.1 Uncharacterized protein ALO57_00040 [Pseudomonas coronafaciens pv. oryzae]KPY92768.1 Uncharacterized protein ALO43_00872 [Pseudomonas tremae]KPZ23539.1 Uncharacterized protein ALO38_03195 [Pseudomonas coronafaciens pv. zizaniae]RMN89657.1 hypothetical protein ALQ50_01509 [Pseudomonas coronafaciens pv. coronafaciens]